MADKLGRSATQLGCGGDFDVAPQPVSDVGLNQARAALAELLDERPTTHSHDAARVELLSQIFGSDVCRKLGIYTIPAGFKLSVVIPVYNEVRTLARVVERVRGTGLPLEIVIVDDGSTDGTRDLLAGWVDAKDPANADLIVVLHERNQGKGGALRTGFTRCTGDVIVVQDADLEYDPQDFHSLLQPIVEDRADVVYGSRFSHVDGQVHHYWHRWGNQLITWLSNWKSGRALTDVETCYKMVRREMIQQVTPTLRERGFGIELELTFKLARIPGVRFYERPISYYGRTYREGKKIGVKDGLWAMWCIVWY